jgi:hypothetical protein
MKRRILILMGMMKMRLLFTNADEAEVHLDEYSSESFLLLSTVCLCLIFVMLFSLVADDDEGEGALLFPSDELWDLSVL